MALLVLGFPIGMGMARRTPLRCLEGLRKKAQMPLLESPMGGDGDGAIAQASGSSLKNLAYQYLVGDMKN